MVLQPFILQMITIVFYLMTLMVVILFSGTVLFLVRKNRAAGRLYLLRPIFAELLRKKTDEIATIMKVPDLVGDEMDVEVPLYRIEKVRRELVRKGESTHLLWLSILVCTAYEEVLSFKNEIMVTMKNDLVALGLHKESEDLTELCRFPITAFTFFKILICIMESTRVPASFLHELEKNAAGYNINRDVNTIRKFNTIFGYINYLGLVILGLFISGVLLLYAGSLPELLVWSLLLMVVIIIAVILYGTFIIDKKLSGPLTCKDIEREIKAHVPGMRIGK